MNKVFYSLFLLLPVLAHAERLHPEKYYQQMWCEEAEGIAEVVLKDRTRADCITRNYAIEVEFANKWTDSVGQALHYARLTGKKPAIVLIIEQEKDWKYYGKLKAIAKKKGIEVWYIKADQEPT